MILLHGALGSATQFDAILLYKPENQSVVALNLPGHGGVACPEPFSMQLFADAVLKYLDQNGLDQTAIFGYSMGGYLALWLACHYPERISRVTTYGTKLDWNPEVASGMNRMFDPEKIETKAPQFAEMLSKIHQTDDWKSICRQTSAFLTDLGNGHGISEAEYAKIQCPVIIGWGDLDTVVTEAESRQVAERIPNGRFEILVGGKHLIEQVDPLRLAGLVFKRDFTPDL